MKQKKGSKKQVKGNEDMIKELEQREQEVKKRMKEEDAANKNDKGEALFGRRDSLHNADEISKDLEKVRQFQGEASLKGKRLDKNIVKYDSYY